MRLHFPGVKRPTYFMKRRAVAHIFWTESWFFPGSKSDGTKYIKPTAFPSKKRWICLRVNYIFPGRRDERGSRSGRPWHLSPRWGFGAFLCDLYPRVDTWGYQ